MNKKRGMSIAAVLGIMVCLVSIVTTVFVLAIRSSVLTSKSLRYIETYNEASTSIDNSVDFMVNEANAEGVTIDGRFVNEKCDAMEMLFGVICTPSVDPSEGEIDMIVGFMVEIKKEFYNMGSEISYLRSVVEFSATMTGGAPQIITPELAINKQVAVFNDRESLYKDKYNSTNLLWNYWSSQLDTSNTESTNKLIELFNKYPGGDLLSKYYEVLNKINNGDLSDADFIDDNLVYNGQKVGFSFNTETLVKYIRQSLENAANNGFVSFNSNCWRKNGDQPTVEKSFATEVNGRSALVINKSIRYDGNVELRESQDLYLTNNSVLYLRGGEFRTHGNVYIERGSSLVIDKHFISYPYEENGKSIAPILDFDYVTSNSQNYEEQHGPIVGGGLIVTEQFVYECASGDGVVLNSNAIGINDDGKRYYKPHINGSITAGKECKIQFDKETENSNSKLPVAATIYCDEVILLSNVAFSSDSNGVRPFLLFGNGQLDMYYCCSLVNGVHETVNFKGAATWDEYAKENVGFGIICVENVNEIKGNNTDIIKFNLFYSNKDQLGGGLDMSELTTKWIENLAVNGINNGLVDDKVFQNCTNDIVTDSIHWYIPDKLRGSFIQAAISSTQSNASRG